MGTMSEMFQDHFHILKSLKRRIILLKQAYFQQKDEPQSIEQIEEILKVLDKGCQFLNTSSDYVAPDLAMDGEIKFSKVPK